MNERIIGSVKSQPTNTNFKFMTKKSIKRDTTQIPL